jgi:hypothetical protein
MNVNIWNKQRYPKFVINRCIGSIIFDYDSLLSKLRLRPIWGSRDDNQANMEMPMK